MNAVVTFGEMMGRLSTPECLRFEQCAPGRWDLTFGGAEGNVAVSVARFGGAARFVTALPKTPVADACVRQLSSLGVDTAAIARTADGRMGLYFVEPGANQRPSVVVYDRAYSAFSLAPAETFDWPAILKDASWFHTTGISPAVSATAAETTRAAMRAAKAAGLTVSIDLNFRKNLWRWEPGTGAEALARKVMPGLLESADLVIGNEEDAQTTLGIEAAGCDVSKGEIDTAGLPAAARAIMDRFPNVRLVATSLRQSVSATHNNWGGMICERGAAHAVLAPVRDGRYTPYEIRDIVDRVGGGDAFAGALIFALNSGEFAGLQPALAFAAAASCLCHSIRGDFNLVSRREVDALAGGDASGRVKR